MFDELGVHVVNVFVTSAVASEATTRFPEIRTSAASVAQAADNCHLVGGRSAQKGLLRALA
ncbi:MULTISPECIES: hypothetical protein [unclassified Parafrankia]|uniref:hypothetical protein n=1 Tax=unclassified Parafrankia TaxID=2994368 RepID=UPI000DA54B71|nr:MULTISPECIES: hypothetical protein [unclassified Parafrankia]TCJ38501.1 hypothetical protein E0504_13450 [Parafrankia sp. BMG5.11]CAI7978485.1 hypothetical protein FRAHR75_480050 [Frankia sp. Hr75.2]SQE00183.1 hypothetical protein FMEAI12_6240003 [Parafrankia sp. Ea1.12]